MFEIPPEVWSAAFLAVPLVVLGWRPWLTESPRTGPWVNALGLAAVGFLVLHLLHAIPPWPPHASRDWLPPALALAAALGLISIRWPRLATLGTALLMVTWVWFAFRLKRGGRWEEDHAVLRTLGLCAGALLPALALGLSGPRLARGVGPPLALFLVLSVCGWLVGNQKYASGGTLLGASSWVVGLLIPIAFLRRDWNVLRGLVPTVSLLLFAIPVHCWSDNLSRSTRLEGIPCALLVLAPLAALMPGEGRRIETLRLLLTVALLGSAVYLGWPAVDPYAY